VMPYVSGESLRHRLMRERQLPLRDALQTARDVGTALDYAHRQGFVHRDIKPENILLADGHAMVADFGIARAISAAGAESVTEAGLALGTPAYMSPEQASAERELDVRLDDYMSLPQGQVTFALTQLGAAAKGSQDLGLLFLVDTKSRSGQLKTNLTSLRKKWVDSGKTLRTEKIRDVEFSVLSLSSNDVPSTLKGFFPQRTEVHELGEENDSKAGSSRSELVIGQSDSLLIIGDSTKAVEKVVIRLSGGSVPALRRNVLPRMRDGRGR